MPARQFAWLVKESSYGTPMTTPVAGTDSIYIRLDGDNACSLRFKPKLFKIPYGGGRSTNAITGADVYETKGKLKTKLYPSQAAMLLNWAGVVINSGRTTPWTTTDASNLMPPGDLASVSVYHAIQRSDGTYKRRQYPGVKVHAWNLSASRDNPVYVLELDLQAIKAVGNAIDASTDPDATAFPAPTEANYPTNPYLFSQSALTIASARTGIQEIKVTSTNKMNPREYEKRYLTLDYFTGRDTTFDAKLLYKPTPDDRASYEAVSALSSQLVLTNGSNSVTLALNAANYFDDIDDDLENEKIYDQGIKLWNNWDPAAGTDLAITVA